MQHKNPPRITSTTTSTCVAKYTPMVVIQHWPPCSPSCLPIPRYWYHPCISMSPLMSHPESLLPICPEPINCLWYEWTTMMMMTLIYLLSLRMNTKSYFGNNECIEINQMHKHSQFKIGTTRQVNGVYLECNVSSVAEEGALSTKSLFIVANLPFEFL